MGLTTDQHDGCLHEIGPDGMQKCYLILPDGERRDLVRPVRRSYVHVGPRPMYPARPLTDEEQERYAGCGYVAYEPYPENEAPKVGRFWTDADLKSGCGSVTTMGQEIAETYAANPSFYGATYCVGCKSHFPVGANGEFVWDGTDEKVGT